MCVSTVALLYFSSVLFCILTYFHQVWVTKAQLSKVQEHTILTIKTKQKKKH